LIVDLQRAIGFTLLFRKNKKTMNTINLICILLFFCFLACRGADISERRALQSIMNSVYDCTNPAQVSAKDFPGIDYHGSKDPRILTCSTKPSDRWGDGNYLAYDVIDDPEDKTFSQGTLKILGQNLASCNRPTHECLHKSLLKDVLDHVRIENGMGRTIKQSVVTMEIPAEPLQHEDFFQYCMDILETTKAAGFEIVQLNNTSGMSLKCQEERYFESSIRGICQDYNKDSCFDHKSDVNFDILTHGIIITKIYAGKLDEIFYL